MIRRYKILKLFSHYHTQNNPKINPLRFILCNPLCTINELPNATESAEELASWLKTPNTQNPDEDFVIPSLANWVESHNLYDQSRPVPQSLSENPDFDVDKVSEIVKNLYPSPDKVVEALNGSCVSVSSSLVEKILRRFSNGWIQAFGVFTWAKTQTGYRHTPKIYNMMIDILGKSKNFDLMWEVVKEMDGYVTLGTMSKVMRRLAGAGRFDDAVEVFRGLERYGVERDAMAMGIVMDILAKERRVDHVYQVFLEFKNRIPLSTRIFNVLISCWCKAKKLGSAWKTMEEMGKQGLGPDVVSYNCFIEHYCGEKDFRKVDDMLKEMEEKGCKPDIFTYTMVMHALGKAKRINEALGVYAKLKSNNDGCCLPDTMFCSSLIFILIKAGRLKDANEIFDDMKNQGVKPDVLTYNTMIGSACERSEEETAFKLLREMEENSCKPDLKTYAPLLKMCCRKKRMKMLDFLLNHMFENDISIDLATYSLLIHGLCKNGKLDQACLFFEEMVSKGIVPMDSSTYKMLVEELVGKRLTNAKEQIGKLMIQADEQERV